MTAFKDLTGLTGIEAIQLKGCARWIGPSANVAALDSTDGASLTFSIKNYASASAMGTVMDAASAFAADANLAMAQIMKALAYAGLATVYYDGTNKIDPSTLP